MKHFKICILFFLTMLSFVIYIDIKTHTILNEVIETTNNIKTSKENIYDEASIINTINNFNENKNMLRVFLNKEHIKNIEVLILNINTAYQYENFEELDNLINELNSSLIFLKSGSFSIF